MGPHKVKVAHPTDLMGCAFAWRHLQRSRGLKDAIQVARSSRSGWSSRVSQQAHRRMVSAVTRERWSVGAGTVNRADARRRGVRCFGCRATARPVPRGAGARITTASRSGERTAMVSQPLPAAGDGTVSDSRAVALSVLVHLGLALPAWMEQTPTAALDVRGAPGPRCRRNAAPVQGDACLEVRFSLKANHRAPHRRCVSR